MARTKFYTVGELIAQYAAQPIEERTKGAIGFNHPGSAEAQRILMSFEGMYPESKPHNERTYAIDRAELHRFVDALAEVDLYAMHKLAAMLIRSPITQHIYDCVKRQNEEEMAKFFAREAHPKPRREPRARVGKAFKQFIEGLDLDM